MSRNIKSENIYERKISLFLSYWMGELDFDWIIKCNLFMQLIVSFKISANFLYVSMNECLCTCLYICVKLRRLKQFSRHCDIFCKYPFN